MKIKNFQGRTVYIMGGSSGIGLAIAKALSAQGAHIVLFARDRDRLEKALNDVRASRTGESQRFACQPLDVSEYPDVKHVLETAVKTHGVPDLLINCAGRSMPNYFEDIPFEQFDEIMRVNLYGTWNTCSVLVPFMQKQGAGQIVNVSSVAGHIAIFGFTDYGASKAAVIALSRVLKSELKPYGIGVSVLLPPDTDTPGYHEENRTRPIETKVISGWSKVIEPDLIARGLLKGLKKGRFMIIPTVLDRFFCFVDRLFPRFMDFMTDMDVRKAQRKKGAT